MLKSIFHSHVKIRHLLAVNALSVLSVYLLFKCVTCIMEFLTMILVGDRSLTERWSISLYSICFAGATATLYAILYYKMRTNFKQERYAEAKSYLIAFIVTLLSIGYLGQFQPGV